MVSSLHTPDHKEFDAAVPIEWDRQVGKVGDRLDCHDCEFNADRNTTLLMLPG